MSFVQGTHVKIWADLTDPITGEPIEPAEVIATIQQPNPAIAPDIRRVSTNNVFLDPGNPGRFWCIFDSTPAAGQWEYQFATVGANAVVERSKVHIRKALAPIV